MFPMSQLQTQQPMTSQIRSHIEYLTHIYDILVLILYPKLMNNVAALRGERAPVPYKVSASGCGEFTLSNAA